METSIDAYLGQLNPIQRKHFDHLRALVIQVAPEATLTMGYGIPTFKLQGKPLMHFGVFKDHMSLFPGAMTADVQEKLHAFKISKGTIQFTDDKPVPDRLVKELLTNRKNIIEKRA